MIWYKDPKILFAESKAQYFFPQDWMSPIERQNALARLVLYTAAILFIIRRDSKIFVLAALALAALYLIDQKDKDSAAAGAVEGGSQPADCTLNPSILDRRPQCRDSVSAPRFPSNWPVDQRGVPMQHMGIERPVVDRQYSIPQQNLDEHLEFRSQSVGMYDGRRGAYLQRNTPMDLNF